MTPTLNAEAFNVSHNDLLSFMLNSVFRDRHAFYQENTCLCPECSLLPLLIPTQMKDAPTCRLCHGCPKASLAVRQGCPVQGELLLSLLAGFAAC